MTRGRPPAESLVAGNFAGHFDLVFAPDVLEHVDDLESAIAGISRVLAPGGGLGFVTHNRTIAAFLRLIWEEERSEEHTSELQSRLHLVCRLLLEKKKKKLMLLHII